MPETPSRSERRRFLADLLFLAGGLTAAAFLGMLEEAPPSDTPNPTDPQYFSYNGLVER